MSKSTTRSNDRNSGSTAPVRHSSSYTMDEQNGKASSTSTYPTTGSQSPPPPPPSSTLNGHVDHLIHGSSETWAEENERILLGPYKYLIEHPGKDIRSQFIAAFNKWLKVPAERLEVITRVVGMLHTASLL